jgi:Omp85 superfamily domain
MSPRRFSGRLLVAALALSLLGPGRAAAQVEGPFEPAELGIYDPLQGMEPSGRIPRVPLPVDLPNPERWRYIPEGRIKPGSIFERHLVSSFFTPQVFFEQAVGAGGGIAVTDIDFRGQRRQEFLGAFLSYTTEGQQKYRLIWRRWLYQQELPGGGIVLEERSFLDAAGGYQKTLTRRFFGLGPDTPPSAESSYTDEALDFGVRSDISLPQAGSDWVLTLGLRGEHHNLAPGRVSGVPTTNQAFPVLFAAGDGRDSMTVSTGIRYDTRDSQHQPYRGWRIGVGVDAPVWQSTGSPGAVYGLYASGSIPVPPLFHSGGDPHEENPPTDTLALGAFVQDSAGDLAFYDLPSLGGTHTLRGYIANRFTDNAAWHASGEYRFWVIPRGFALTRAIRVERIGLALFGDVGTVAHSLGDLPSARIHTSYGIGLRVSLERTALFRADFGFSGEGLNFTLAFGLSF